MKLKQRADAAVSAALRRYLETGDPNGELSIEDVLSEDGPRAAWRAVKHEMLPAFIAAHPGRRPWIWWLADAPENRQRVGGTGDDYAAVGWCQSHAFGLPRFWMNRWLCEYYNGRARHVDGHRIGTQYRAGQFPHVGVDPHDLPTFESQASFLKRHGLLTRDEARRLTATDFAPEPIVWDGNA